MENKTNKKTSKETNHSGIKVSDKVVGTRGRSYEGYVTKKFSTRVVVEFARPVFVRKFERFMNKKTKLHARLPQGINVEVGDLISVRHCRPLSKIVHHVVIGVVRKAGSDSDVEAKK